MHFNHDGRDAVLLGVELSNRFPQEPAELQRLCVLAGLVLERSVTGAARQRVETFLVDWLQVVDEPDPLSRADLLNNLLDTHTAAPRMTDHAGTGWHLHFRPDDLPADRQIAALISVGTALHLTGRGMSRLGRCASAPCTTVFADVSRNGRQRYCSPGCGNRDAVRRHRTAAVTI